MEDDERDTNLLAETIECLEGHGKTSMDVRWAGSLDGRYSMTWGEFVAIARDVMYDSGFGAAEIATDLVIVGVDWWLSRWEYDGSEGWEVSTLPLRMADAAPIKNLGGRVNIMWKSVSELNGGGGHE